jgi:hypothetical protein
MQDEAMQYRPFRLRAVRACFGGDIMQPRKLSAGRDNCRMLLRTPTGGLVERPIWLLALR